MDPRFFVNPSAFKDPSKIGAPSAMQGGALPSGIDGRFFVNPSAFSNPSKVGAPSALQGGAKRPRRTNAAHIDARFFVNPIDFSDPSKIGAPSAMMTGGKRPHELLEDGLTQMQGGARTTIEAGAAALLHPKDAIDELKSMFNHVGQIFSSTDIGGNIRIHLLPAVQILIKYLPLGGAPGYAAAVALERLLPRAGKIIELIATIMDFFTGRKDFFQMLSAFKDMVEDLWHQFMDIVPKVAGMVGHAVSEAIGSNDTTATLSNMLLGTNYESPAVKKLREDYEEVKRKAAVDNAARDAENTRKTAEYAEKVIKDAAEAKIKDAEDKKRSLEEDTKKAKEYAIKEILRNLGYTAEQVDAYGTAQTDPAKIAPLTLQDQQLIKNINDNIGKPDYQKKYDELFPKAMASHTNLNDLWAAANEPALKQQALGATGATKDAAKAKIEKLIAAIKVLPGGMKFLADHGDARAKQVVQMEQRTPEIQSRIDAIKDIVRQGGQLEDEDKQFMADQGEPLTGGSKRRR
jgi:hypothetical protein